MSRNIDYTELDIRKPCIGFGAFGDVYKAIWKNCNGLLDIIVVKEYRDCVPETDIERELRFLRLVNHENIISIVGISKNPCNKTVILMEYATCGSLDRIMQKTNNHICRISHSTKLNWMHQFAEGLNYLHDLCPKLIHRDLKPQNLLITHEFRTLKICDFGTVKELGTVNTTDIGTAAYMAPEVCTTETYTEKCDVYSFGIIFWEVLSKKNPYYHLGKVLPLTIQIKSIDGDRPILDDLSTSENSEFLIKLIEMCWHPDPSKRPTMKNILDDMKPSDRSTMSNLLDFNLISENYCMGIQNSYQALSIVKCDKQNVFSMRRSRERSILHKIRRIFSLCCLWFSCLAKRRTENIPQRIIDTPEATSVNTTKPINWSDIKLIKNIGGGTFRDVHKAVWKSMYGNRTIAVTIIRYADIGIEEIETYLQLILNLRHDNIISLYGISKDDNARNVILMEYADCGSLYSLLHEEDSEFGSEFSEHSAKIWMLQCAKGLAYLHKENIIHRDLKTRILLLTNNLKTLKIGGLDSTTKFKSNLTNMVGTVVYMPPEIAIENSSYSQTCDVYSYGIILWEVLSRRKPFYHLQNNNFKVLQQISQGNRPYLSDVKCTNSDRVRDLIENCWNQDPQLRPDMKSVVDGFANFI